jgi:hypothetical protein
VTDIEGQKRSDELLQHSDRATTSDVKQAAGRPKDTYCMTTEIAALMMLIGFRINPKTSHQHGMPSFVAPVDDVGDIADILVRAAKSVPLGISFLGILRRCGKAIRRI